MAKFEVKKIGAQEPIENNSLEEDIKSELNEFQEEFKKNTKAEKKRINDAVSTGFWFCAYFADVGQCREFLEKAGVFNKMEAQYINGEMLADALGIEITKKKITPPPSFKKHKGFSSLVMKK